MYEVASERASIPLSRVAAALDRPTPTKPERDTVLNEIDRRLNVITERLYQQQSTVGQLGDRALGEQPETDGVGCAREPNPYGGITGEVFCRLDQIDSALDRLDGLTKRIANIA